MRDRFPPERIVELAERLVEHAESEQVRLSALQLIVERSHGKVLTTIAVEAPSTAPQLPEGFAELSPERKLATIRELRARALAAGSGNGER